MVLLLQVALDLQDGEVEGTRPHCFASTSRAMLHPVHLLDGGIVVRFDTSKSGHQFSLAFHVYLADDALTTIKQIKGLATELGGMKHLKALVEALSE